jgi:hypothetical protein
MGHLLQGRGIKYPKENSLTLKAIILYIIPSLKMNTEFDLKNNWCWWGVMADS